MRIKVLGSAAGGGFPQWNCNCPNCTGVRAGTLRARARTQTSIFVRPDDGIDGILIGASPDILQQIGNDPALQPGRQLRDSAIAGVVLPDGQIDQVAGLLMLRERRAPLPVWCTDAVAADLSGRLPLFQVLGHYCGVERRSVPLEGRGFEVQGVPGLGLRALPISSRAAPYSPHRDRAAVGDNVALSIADAGRGTRLFYSPGLGEISPAAFDAMACSDCVLVDGTFWHDDEMRRLGLSERTARDIGHLPMAGPGGMLEHLRALPAGVRKVLIHINNTNPVLDEASAERAQLRLDGIELAEDGMTITL